MAVFVIAAFGAFVIVPMERIGTVGFRLLFDGASGGRYPNGTPFSSGEITSTPVLTEVFDVNGLGDFGSYRDFKNSIFILRSNPELDLLSYEYQTKLTDSSLTPVDRLRIEDEFESKRESLTGPRFTLNLRQDERIVRMPPSLMSKVLDDTLAIWARQAKERKGALLYDVTVLSSNILRRGMIEGNEFLISVDMLRTHAMQIVTNIEEISTLPGAAVLRTRRNRTSLAESRTELEDILRFQILPLFGALRISGLSKDPGSATSYIKNQLFQIRLEYEEAQKRLEAVRTSLRAYTLRTGAVAVPQASSGSEGAILGLGSSDQALSPQLGESFLDRLVEMSTINGDAEYRQQLTDRAIAESFAMAALQREQGFYEEIGNTVRDVGPSLVDVGREDELSSVRSRLEKAYTDVGVVVEYVSAIYEELSTQNLNLTTLLYAMTTPFTRRTERALPLSTVGLYGLLVFMLSLVVVPLGCLVHSYVQGEVVHREKEEQPAGRALGGQSEGQRKEKTAERTASV